MPKQIIFRATPVLTSVVSYDVAEGEEPYLSYTWERAQGPTLRRSGGEAPEMPVIDGQTGEMTTHPVALRFGTWLVLERCRSRDEQELRQALDKLPHGSKDIGILRKMITESPLIESHENVFGVRVPDREVIGMQGCGDLTMNDWNVAFVQGAMSESGGPALVTCSDEPLETRRYTCFVKWLATGDKQARVTIEEVKFNRYAQRDVNNMVSIRFGERWLPRGKHIEFAVSNQQVIRNGAIVSAVASSHQFGDLRHLLMLPNLNPDEPLVPGDVPPYRPRRFFAADQTADFWLGEKYLLDGGNNIRRAALSAAVAISIPNDCDTHLLRSALLRVGYEEVFSGTVPLQPGEWRFTDLLPKEKNAVEIYFRRNTYAWSMLGLTRDNERILSLACQAKPGETGYVLEDAAKILLDCGAWNALLIDEGGDVFQIMRDAEGVLRELVNLYRSRLRAVFIFGKRFQREGVDT